MIRGKKTLVTGAGGFIGSHLVEALVEKGSKVRAFVHYNSFNRWGWLDYVDRKIKDSIEIFPGDVRDPNRVGKSIENIDVIFHLAALIGIPYSYYSPDSYVHTNIQGTLNILQAAGKTQVEKIIHTSTSEVYGTAEYVPIDEKHPRQGQSLYSATKIGADFIAQSFYRNFDLPVTIARPFNTYGPRQSARAVIPTIITQLVAGREEIMLGSLHPTRDFVYVKDTVAGLIEIAESNATSGEEMNIATQREISIGHIAQMLIKEINPNAKIKEDHSRIRPSEGEIERLLGSNDKIIKLTGWRQAYTLEQGLKETIKWFKKKDNLRLYKPDIYNV